MDNDDIKNRIKNALHRHSARQIKTPRKRKNNKPEAKLAASIIEYFEARGWSLDIVESKAVWSVQAGAYVRGQARAGFSDIVGNDPNGMAVYIEVKAPGKRSTLRPAQHDFLAAKIKTKAFAVCADSIQYIELAWREWRGREDLLLKELPVRQSLINDRDDDFNID